MNNYEIPRTRMEEISDMAEYFAESCCRSSAVILPQDIAGAIGLKYSTGNYKEGFDGLTRYRNRRFHVFINTRQSDHLFIPRVRFSFAHELGHFTMPWHRQALMQPGARPHGSKLEYCFDCSAEREAEYYAACLLMPEKRMRRDIANRRFSFVLVDELSKKYQVSITSTLIRLIGLNVYPLMVVCTRNNKIAWQRCTSDFPFYSVLRGLTGEVPVNTCAGEYFDDGRKYSSTQEVYADDWFLLRNPSDRRRKFSEHCVYYEPLKQVISVLWER